MNFCSAIIVSLVVFIAFVYCKWYNLTKQFVKFPGPRPWIPLFGNTGILALKKNVKNALNDFLESLYHQYKKEGMFFLLVGHRPILYLFKPEFVKEIIKDSSAYNKSERYDLFVPLFGHGLFTTNGQRWKAKRKLLNPAFHLDVLDKFMPEMNEQIRIMVTQIEKHNSLGYIDVRPFLCNLAIDVITTTAMGLYLGVQLNGENEFVKCTNRSFGIIFDRLYCPLLWNDFLFYLTKAGKQFKSDIKFVHHFTQEVIRKRKQLFNRDTLTATDNQRLAFLDLLIANQAKDASITDDEIQEDVDTFMIAGNETTSTALSWTFLLLGNHIDVQQKVREELNAIFGDDTERDITREELSKMAYTESVIKESMRMFPPVPFVARVPTKDIIVNGLKYPKGNTVYINILKLHLDEETFHEPTKFNPERFLSGDLNKINSAFMPFAAGLRSCIGQRFSMLEMKMVLAYVFRKYSAHCLNRVEQIEKTFDITLRPINEIKVKFSPLF